MSSELDAIMSDGIKLIQKVDSAFCPRCIEDHDGEDGQRVSGSKVASACEDCGVCENCDHLKGCEKADDSDDSDDEKLDDLDWEWTHDFIGGSLQGGIEATFDQLVEVFGRPYNGPDDHEGDKVSCEWNLLFNNGTYATIYDYKENGKTPRGMYDWHIGGQSIKCELYVKHVFNRVHAK